MPMKKEIILTKTEREARTKRYAEEQERILKFMIDDYNNPQSNTKEIIETLAKM